MRGRLSSPVTPRMLRSAAFAMLCVIWGSTWLAIRIGLQGAPPFLAATLRFLLASITLAALALVFRSKWPANRTEWALVLFVGLVLFTADYGLIYWGENNGVESGLSAILFATLPLQTALVANAILPGERLTVQKLAGIGLGFGGILLIFRGQVGTASLAVVSLGAKEPWGTPSWPEGIGAILFLALAGSVVTFVTWQWLLKTAEATSLSFVALITPITAVLLGAGVGNEKFDAIDLIGSAIVLAGIYVSISRRVAGLGRAVVGRTAPVSDPVDPPGRRD